MTCYSNHHGTIPDFPGLTTALLLKISPSLFVLSLFLYITTHIKRMTIQSERILNLYQKNDSSCVDSIT